MPLLKAIHRLGSFQLLALLLICSCNRGEKHGAFANAPVIIISIDTLRADHLPLYGYQKVETPNIDALGRDGVLYKHAYSHCPMTLPSHVSMLTGLLPTEHQVRNNLGYKFDQEKHETLPRLLARRGYATGAAVSSYVLRADTGLGDIFDFYDDAIPVATAGAASQHQRSGLQTLETAKRWIAGLDSKPFFFLFHLYEPHAPYDPPEPFRSRYPDRYDGEIALSDSITGEFLNFLRARGIYDRAIIILVSDHGEGLWQHGEDQHGILLYREVLQVPLIVKLPGSARRGAQVSAPVQLIDLFPTVARLLGAETEGMRGLSIIDLVDKSRPARRIYSETFYPRIHLGWSELRSLIDDRYHYIESPKSELYDVQSDPAEKVDIIASERRVASSMDKELKTNPSGVEEIGAIDPEDAAKLAALGYLGSVRSSKGSAALPNPRDMLPYLEKIKRGFLLAEKGQYLEAIQHLRRLVQENPGLFDARDKLGELLVETAQYDEAIVVYREAMSRSERFSPEMALSLGDAYLRAGQPDEAKRYAELAMKAIPSNAHSLLARVAIEQREFANAEREANQAIGEKNKQPAVMLLLADVRRAAGDLPGAMRALEEAGARARELKVATLCRLDFLRGDVLARMGRPAEAEAAYLREIENCPRNTQAYANLSIIYFIGGRQLAVNEILERMVAANPHPAAWKLATHTLESLENREAAIRWRRRAEARFGLGWSR